MVDHDYQPRATTLEGLSLAGRRSPGTVPVTTSNASQLSGPAPRVPAGGPGSAGAGLGAGSTIWLPRGWLGRTQNGAIGPDISSVPKLLRQNEIADYRSPGNSTKPSHCLCYRDQLDQ